MMTRMRCLLIAAVLLTGTLYAQHEITFSTESYEQAVARAKAEGKMVFVDVMADWCGPCKAMEKRVFNQQEVAEYWNTHFVSLRVDVDDEPVPSLTKVFDYSQTAIPAFLFISPEGALLRVEKGYREPADFLSLGKEVQDPENHLTAYHRRYDKGERNIEFMLKYLHMLQEAKHEKTRAVHSQLVAALSKDQYFDSLYVSVVYSEMHNLDATHVHYLLLHREEFDQKYGQGAANDLLMEAWKEEYAQAWNDVKKDRLEQLKQWGYKAFGAKETDSQIRYTRLRIAFRTAQWADLFVVIDEFEKAGDPLSSSNVNSIAWGLYEACDDPVYLNSALKLMERCTECKTQYAMLDTHAALLYKLGRSKEGEKMAKKAIEVAKKNGDDYSGTEELMQKYQ